MNIKKSLASAVALFLALASPMSSGQSAPAPTTTRLLVTSVHVKPDRVEQWLALQENEVVPALKKAGVKDRVVYETIVGDAMEFVSVRPLPSFAEFGDDGLLARALGSEQAQRLRGELMLCIDGAHRQVVNRLDEFNLDPGDAEVLFASLYRTQPGRSRDYVNFIRTEMYPVMRQAQLDGTFSGLSVTVSAQGGEAGLIMLNMHYPEFAPLDGPPPIAKTLGPEGTREFLTKGAGLITPLEQRVLKRLPGLSFGRQ